MNVLVVNCGSSSLKYQLLDMTNETELAKGLFEKIGDQTLSSLINVQRRQIRTR